VFAVQQAEVHLFRGLDGGVQADRDRDETEGDVTGPDRAWHAAEYSEARASGRPAIQPETGEHGPGLYNRRYSRRPCQGSSPGTTMAWDSMQLHDEGPAPGSGMRFRHPWLVGIVALLVVLG